MGYILLYTKNTTHCYINCHGNHTTLCTYRYTNKICLCFYTIGHVTTVQNALNFPNSLIRITRFE